MRYVDIENSLDRYGIVVASQSILITRTVENDADRQSEVLLSIPAYYWQVCFANRKELLGTLCTGTKGGLW